MDANLELSDQAVEVARHQALAQQFDAVHPIVGKTVRGTVLPPRADDRLHATKAAAGQLS